MKKIQCPVLLIQGIDDEYGSLKQIDSIAEQLSQPTEKLLIPDCGHFPHITARKQVEAKILEFIEHKPLWKRDA